VLLSLQTCGHPRSGGILMRALVSGDGLNVFRAVLKSAAAVIVTLFGAAAAQAQAPGEAPGGEANLKLPDLSQVNFLGMDGHKLLLFGILFCIFGLVFGMVIYTRLKNLPVHRAMREISELIYETCKTYLITQGKFLLLLELFIAVVIVLYFRQLRRGLVWYSRKHICEFANRFRRPARQTVSALPHSAPSRDEHRHDVDQRGTADDAFDPAFCSR
jgi:hypothetical protein